MPPVIKLFLIMFDVLLSMQVFLFSEAPVSIRTMFYCAVLSS